MNTGGSVGIRSPRESWWTAAFLGTGAGVAALAADAPAAAAVPALIASAALVVYFLHRPQAWPVWFLAAGLLTPPVSLAVAGTEIPLHLSMAVFAAALPVVWVRLPEWRIHRNTPTVAAVLLLAVLLASLPWAFSYSGAVVGAQSVLRWMLLAAGFMAAAWVAFGPESQRDDEATLLRVLLAGALAASAFAIADFLYQLPRTARSAEQFIYLGSGPLRRAQGVFYDASALGNFCAMILTLILALGRDARKALRIPGWVLWSPLPLLAVALVLSFSRGSVACLLVSAAVLAWLRRGEIVKARALLALTGGSLAAAAATVFLAGDFLEPYGLRLQFTALEFFARPNEVLSQRLATWTALAEFVSENPLHLLAGIGYKTAPYSSYLPVALSVDNMYLSVLVECGLPGLAALVFFCAAILGAAARLLRSLDAAVAGLGRFLFAFWCGEMVQMLSGDILTYWRVTPVYLAVLALAWRRHERSRA